MERFLPAYRAELTAFAAVARGALASPCTVHDALQAFRVAEACELSRREGRPVALDEIPACEGRGHDEHHDHDTRRHGIRRHTTSSRSDAPASTSTRSSTASGSRRCAPSRSSSAAARPTSRVAAARHGHRTALITRTGQDAFGRYIHEALRDFGVDDALRLRRRRPADAGHLLRGLPARRLPALLLPLPDRARPHDRGRRAAARRDPRRGRLLGHRHRALAGAEPGRALPRLGGPRPAHPHRARPRLPPDVLGRPGRGERAGRPRARRT